MYEVEDISPYVRFQKPKKYVHTEFVLMMENKCCCFFCYCDSLIELGVCHNFSEKHREELCAFGTPANSAESDLRLYHVWPQ